MNKIFDGSEKSFNDIYNEISLGGSVKKDLSKILGVKVFPKNVVVKALMTTQVVDGGVAVPLTVETTTNLVLLPKVPMKATFRRPRVGFLPRSIFILQTGNSKWEKGNSFIVGDWNRNRKILRNIKEESCRACKTDRVLHRSFYPETVERRD